MLLMLIPFSLVVCLAIQASAETFTLTTTVQAHNRHISALAISPDGSLLATGSGADNFSVGTFGEVKIWAVPGDIVMKHQYYTGASSVRGLAFSRDASELLSASSEIVVWNLAENRAKTLIRYTGLIHKYNSSPTNPYVAVTMSSRGNYIVARDVTTEFVKRLKNYKTGTTNVAIMDFDISPDGKTLAVAGFPRSAENIVGIGCEDPIVFFSCETWEETARWKSSALPFNQVEMVKYIPDANKIILIQCQGIRRIRDRICIVDVGKTDTVVTVDYFPGYISDMAVCRGPKYFAVVARFKIYIINYENGNVLQTLEKRQYSKVIFAKEGRQLFAGTVDGSVEMYEAREEQK